MRSVPFRNIRDWQYDNDPDDAALFKTIMDRAFASGDKYFIIPPKPTGDGSWVHDLDIDDVAHRIDVPSGVVIKGLNKHAKIHCTGGFVTTNTSVFRIYGAIEDVLILDLHFYGDNGSADGTGFVYTLNKQSNPIFIRQDVSSNKPKDITVQGCTFENLHGFSVHDISDGERNHVIGCTTRYCANGININCNHSHQIRNSIHHSEPFEATGAGYIVAYNTITEGLKSAIGSFGGAGELHPGSVVGFNVGTVDATEQGEGMSFGDGFVDGLCIGNTIQGITDTFYYGITAGRQAFGAAYLPRRNIYALNRVINAANGGINANAPDSLYDTNLVICGGLGMSLGADNIAVVGNKITPGAIASNRVFQIANDPISGVPPVNMLVDASNDYAPIAWYDAVTASASFKDGSFLRLTAEPVASAQWRGVEVAVRAGAGVADIRSLCTKDSSDAYGWRSLI